MLASTSPACWLAAAALALVACSGNETLAHDDAHDDSATDGLDIADDVLVDSASDGLDIDDGCPDEASYELGDAPFVLTGCAADPAVAVIEVQLDTMQARGYVATAPEAPVALTAEGMRATLLAGIEDNGCPRFIFNPGNYVATSGSMTGLFILPGDSYALGMFDSRTGEMGFSMTGDWFSGDARCTPDPLADLVPAYAAAAEPASTFRFCMVGSDLGTCADPPPSIDALNSCGDRWTSMDSTCWVERTYEEVWNLVKHTAHANAMASCGPYEMFVRELGCGGGAYSGDEHRIRMIFILAGHVDTSVLP
jgi:hypothetical protein